MRITSKLHLPKVIPFIITELVVRVRPITMGCSLGPDVIPKRKLICSPYRISQNAAKLNLADQDGLLIKIILIAKSVDIKVSITYTVKAFIEGANELSDKDILSSKLDDLLGDNFFKHSRRDSTYSVSKKAKKIEDNKILTNNWREIDYLNNSKVDEFNTGIKNPLHFMHSPSSDSYAIDYCSKLNSCNDKIYISHFAARKYSVFRLIRHTVNADFKQVDYSDPMKKIGISYILGYKNNLRFEQKLITLGLFNAEAVYYITRGKIKFLFTNSIESKDSVFTEHALLKHTIITDTTYTGFY